VLALRAQCVAAYSQLLAKPYTPYAEVFARIEDGKPWWGLFGESVFGPGEESIKGPAEESRFLLNPFLLVAANPYTARLWKANSVLEEELAQPDFPHTWLPSSITWWPKESRGQVVYDVTRFNQQVARLQEKAARPAIRNLFGLVAYNARDFGFEYLYVSKENSINIENTEAKSHAVKIKQMLHCGDSCKYPGNCNNMSPRNDNIDRIMYSAVPAKARVLLWQKKPRNIRQKPDMTFDIELR
jgi:hypothetical protein